MKSKRFEKPAERPINRETFIKPWPETGLVTIASPLDPAPTIRIEDGKVYINGLEGFWSYAKERLIKRHGVSKEKFPFYLKEMEFRYNNRNTEIFT